MTVAIIGFFARAVLKLGTLSALKFAALPIGEIGYKQLDFLRNFSEKIHFNTKSHFFFRCDTLGFVFCDNLGRIRFEFGLIF